MPVDNRLRLLLLALVAVLGLRFAFVPWLGWLDEKRQELQVLTDRLERSDSVLANEKAIRQALATHEKHASALRARFPAKVLPGDYRIKVQQAIGEMAAANNLVLQSFEWVLESEVDRSGLQHVRARLTLSGAPRGLAAMHAKLDSEYPNLIIQEVSFGAGGLPVIDPDTAGQNLTLVGDFFILSSSGVGK